MRKIKNIINSCHLRGMIVNSFIIALLHSDTIKDKEQFITDFSELINNYVVSSEEDLEK